MADLEYPLGVRNYQHVMLSAWEYGLPGVDNKRSTENRGKKLWNTFMYIPAALADRVSSSWEAEEISATAQSINDIAGASEIMTMANLKQFGAGVGRDVFNAADKLAPGAVKSFNSNVAAHHGTLLRPNDVLVLSGISNNSITFNWTMSPKNAEEAKQIKQIIRTFKNAARPTLSGADSVFMDYPPLIDVFIRRQVTTGEAQSRKGNQKDLFSYNNMVIESFNVTYEGGANEALFYYDGHPIFTTMSISLKSIRPGYYTEGGEGSETTG